MSFSFPNLDAETRRLMLEEIDLARQTENIYFSKRFNDAGEAQWVALLKQAAESHNEHWLAYQIEALRLMKDYEHAQKLLGGYTIKHVPHTAAETQAEGQFNRFYIIAICRLALEQGRKTVIIFRAKERTEHRPQSDALIGTQESADDLIKELRDVQNSLNHKLLRPNSGLSVKTAR